MKLTQYVSRSLILRSLAALSLGGMVVAAFISILSIYGVTPEPVEKHVMATSLPFPQNEQQLNRMSAELEREGQKLSKTEPAAGN